MNEKTKLEMYLGYDKINHIFRRFFYQNRVYRPRTINGIRVMTQEEGNEYLRNLIDSGEPFAAIRYGAVEMNAYVAAKKVTLGLASTMDQNCFDTLQNNAGFFPNDLSLIDRYVETVEQTSKYIDIFATYAWPLENYMVNEFMKSDVKIVNNRALEPYYFQNKSPWSSALEGKKVLVINPFVETIQDQYTRHENLFKDSSILPKFELCTLKAVQTIAGKKDTRFLTWFDALKYMYDEALKVPFDIALIGCGAYGQPLACMLKNAGKQAIQMGGATQILFGVKGKRWDSHPVIKEFYNEYWVRPSEKEKPDGADCVENGCYW